MAPIGFNIEAAQTAINAEAEKPQAQINHNAMRDLPRKVTYSYVYSPAPFSSSVLVEITRIRWEKENRSGVFYTAAATFESPNAAINGMKVSGMKVSNGEKGPRITMPGDQYTPEFVSSSLMDDLKEVIVKEVARKVFAEELPEDEKEVLTGDKILVITGKIITKAYGKISGLLKAFGLDPETTDDWAAETVGDQISEISSVIGYTAALELEAIEAEEDEDEEELLEEVPF